MQLKKQSNLLV